jgi:hypothetical protein
MARRQFTAGHLFAQRSGRDGLRRLVGKNGRDGTLDAGADAHRPVFHLFQ